MKYFQHLLITKNVYFIKNNLEQTSNQLSKENYIANMLIRTLYSNDVNNAECYRIIKLLKEKVLGNVMI